MTNACCHIFILPCWTLNPLELCYVYITNLSFPPFSCIWLWSFIMTTVKVTNTELVKDSGLLLWQSDCFILGRKTLELGTRKAIECFKQILKAIQVRAWNEWMLREIWFVKAHFKSFQSGITLAAGLRGHSCDILKKNLVIFCPCHENLPEHKLKSNALISLPEQIWTNYIVNYMSWL